MRLLAVQFVVLTLAALTARAAPAADEGTPPSGAVVIYTKDNAPATPKLDAFPLKESVSEYGITWTFEKPVRVGQSITPSPIGGNSRIMPSMSRMCRFSRRPLSLSRGPLQLQRPGRHDIDQG